MTFQPGMQNAAAGFLYNPKTREVLLHLRDGNTKVNPHKWAFFGGLCEEGELPLDGFIREVAEELSINIDPATVRSLCDYYNADLDKYRNVFYVESDLPKSAMKLTEGADFDWVSLEKAFDLPLTKYTIKDLKFFIAQLEAPIESSQ